MSETAVHNFPAQFPLDTDYLYLALAEHNHLNHSELKFDELDRDQQSRVLARAQSLKTGNKAAQ